MSNRARWALLGVADHQAVANVGGRLGAARGPMAFRRSLDRTSGRLRLRDAMNDLGDITSGSNAIEAIHRQVADAVSAAVGSHDFTVIVGGGNDHAHAQLLGVRAALPPGARLGCINIDAHLDVRKPAPAITSGSPFYLSLEAGVIRADDFVEFGIQPQCNGIQLWDYVDAKKIRVIELRELRDGRAADAFADVLAELARHCHQIAVCLDLDAVAAAYAPGVSAPQSDGFTPGDVFRMMEIAGRESKVSTLGIYELNPEHDIDSRTALLAATSAWHFVNAGMGRK